MSMKTLTADIRDVIERYGGYVFSEGTLNPLHLLAKAHDLLRQYRVNTGLRKKVRSAFVVREWRAGDDLWTHVYHGRAEIKDDELASCIWNEDIFDYFNTVAPGNSYFGSHEGDGACFGWWKVDQDGR
ncbi:hypothetical protein [Cohnella thermotolerans]|uniref:hypothetical protein n=1 Tax=Cohnella thermotolerans TaxID=329858 RepID=UPI00042A23D3|nr:hypothetical protein [Cohnella thermotolerans]